MYNLLDDVDEINTDELEELLKEVDMLCKVGLDTNISCLMMEVSNLGLEGLGGVAKLSSFKIIKWPKLDDLSRLPKRFERVLNEARHKMFSELQMVVFILHFTLFNIFLKV